jgi:putative ABC transport system permease protein
MTLGRLVQRNVLSHPVRTSLTVGAVMVAIFLLCLLRSIVTSLDAAVKEAATNRIMVTSAVSFFQALPYDYAEKVAAMEGVASVSKFTWFGGAVNEEDPPEPQFGVDAENLLRNYPDVVIPEAQKKAWFETPRGCIVGADVAAKHGWSVGETVHLFSTVYPRKDERAWEFEVCGIYRSLRANLDEQTMFFHFRYLNETFLKDECYGFWDPSHGNLGTSALMVLVKDGHVPDDVIRRIDDHFEGGPQRTRTQPEAVFQAGFISMLGNLPLFLSMIGGAVLVALLFGVVNTLTIAARARVKSMGVLKAMGFPDRLPWRLYFLEALVLVGVGGALGIGLALATQAPMKAGMGQFVPRYFVAGDTLVMAGLVCLVMAFLAGAFPAWAASRTRAVDALRA